MGMYTEFETNLLLKKETPKKVLDMIKLLIIDDEANWKLNEDYINDHAFFSNSRYHCVLNWNNCTYDEYEEPTLVETDEGFVLTSNSEFKNYGDPIGLFLDWLHPYIVKGFLDDGAVARKKYEEYYTSTYIHKASIGYTTIQEPDDNYYRRY